jgi:lysozyme
MRAISIVCLLMAMSWSLVGWSQTFGWTEADWQPLTNEPSRQELLRSSMSSTDLNIFFLPRSFKFPENTLTLDNGPQTFGLDISHYSAALPFGELWKKNIWYVYIKATQGTGYKDPKFKENWKAVGNLPASQRIARGAYHFLSATKDPKLQAEKFVAYVNLQGGFNSDDLPPVMDLEWDKASSTGRDRWAKKTSSEIIAAALTFLERVEELTGRIPMIYTSTAWWRERGISESKIGKFARYKLWIADYSGATRLSENPRAPGNVVPQLWQFTDRSTVSGVSSGSFDANAFKGTLEEFNQEFIP